MADEKPPTRNSHRHFLNILNAFNIHHILNMPNILNRAECRGNDRLILLFLPH